MTAPIDSAALVACALRAATADPTLVDALSAAVAAHADVTDRDVDEGREMTWLAFAGSPDAIARAVHAAATAAAPIDVGRRRVDAPALGAIDRVRLSPVYGLDLAACVAMAHTLAVSLAADLDVPVYLTDAATPPGAERRAQLLGERGYAGLRATLATEPSLRPDQGPAQIGAIGATRIGATPLDARFEIDVDVSESQANRLASALDGRSGGLADVRASAVARHGGVAIAVRLLAPERTTLWRTLAVLDAIAAGRARGVRLRGCWSQAALWAAIADGARLGSIEPTDVWENRIPAGAPAPTSASTVHESVPEGDPDDDERAGGAAAAAVAARHAARLAKGIAARSAARAEGDDAATMVGIEARSAGAINTLSALATADRAAYARVLAAFDRPRGTIDEARARRDSIQAALLDAIEVPLGILRQAVDVLRGLRELAARGDVASVADCGTASYVALAAARGAALSVGTQVPGLRDLERGDRLRGESGEMLREAEGLAAAVDGLVRERIRA